jgi:aspartate 4-decarboxylase
MAAESRSVALRLGPPLSSPQQAQATLYALYLLTGAGRAFTEEVVSRVAERLAALRSGLGVTNHHLRQEGPFLAVVDVLACARERHGPAFASWLELTGDPAGFAAVPGDAPTPRTVRRSGMSGWAVGILLADHPAERHAAWGDHLVRRLDAAFEEYGAAGRGAHGRRRTGERARGRRS